MYIVNNFCYGIDVNKYTDLPKWYIEQIAGNYLSIKTDVYDYYDKKYILQFDDFYSGDNTNPNYFSGIIGFNITDDDHNSEYSDIIRDSNGEFFKELWDKHYTELLEKLLEIIEDDLISADEEELVIINQFKNIFLNGEPEFYTVRTTS